MVRSERGLPWPPGLLRMAANQALIAAASTSPTRVIPRCFDALVLVAGWLRASAWASSLARWAVARASVTRLEARFCGRLVSLCPEGPSGPGVCLDSFADIGMCLLRAAHLRRTMQAVRRAGGRMSRPREGRMSPTREGGMSREIEAGCRWTCFCTWKNRLLACPLAAWLFPDGL